MPECAINLNESYEKKFGWKVDVKSVNETEPGLSEKTLREISGFKGETGEHEWIHNFRLKALKYFLDRPTPKWGGNLSGIDFDDIIYYLNPLEEKGGSSWEDLPPKIRETFDKLGIPEAEKKILAGAGAQFDSETVYHKVREDLAKQGVIFVDPDIGLQKHPEIFKKWFGKIVPPNDNKFAALNSAVFSGGSFIYIPKGVQVDMPLQAYFRINADRMGQFERTLIIADEGSRVHYIEGCFTKGTPITTVCGESPIENVREGELVLTHRGRFRNVSHVQKRKYSGKLYKIRYYGDTTQEIHVTEEHPMLVSRRRKEEFTNTQWDTDWVPASAIRKGDYLAMPIDNRVEKKDEIVFPLFKGAGRHGFKEVKLRLKSDGDLFRLVGYYLSEGSISGESYVNFSFNKSEREPIEDVKHLVRNVFGKEPHEHEEYNGGISLTLSSVLAARFFETNFGRGAGNKHIPEWVMLESPKKQAELVKGAWLGDGSFMYERYKGGTKKMFRINSVSRRLAAQLRNMLLRLGVFASLHKAERSGNRKDMYTLYIGGRFILPFSSTVGFDIGKAVSEKDLGDMKLLENLSSFANISGGYAFVPVKDIDVEDVMNLDVYNFGVEEDESYVANNVAVHNCTAPVYTRDALHSAVVEIVALPESHVRYTTLQNWSKNVYNLVTKRAVAHENSIVEWIDANMGSKLTMKYPSVFMKGRGARADILSVAFAGEGQHQDTGAKAVHLAPDTTSRITAKSVSKDGGRTSYRGLLHVAKKAANVKSSIRCDALLLDEISKTDTYPYNEIQNDTAVTTHEASVGKIGEEQLFYLMSRGLSENEALNMIVTGFFDAFAKEIPLEYAVEFNRLIQLEMSGAVG